MRHTGANVPIPDRPKRQRSGAQPASPHSPCVQPLQDRALPPDYVSPPAKKGRARHSRERPWQLKGRSPNLSADASKVLITVHDRIKEVWPLIKEAVTTIELEGKENGLNAFVGYCTCVGMSPLQLSGASLGGTKMKS